MRGLIGAGIDDRDAALADDVSAGPREGKGSGIVGHDSAHEGRQPLAKIRMGRESGIENEIVRHRVRAFHV